MEVRPGAPQAAGWRTCAAVCGACAKFDSEDPLQSSRRQKSCVLLEISLSATDTNQCRRRQSSSGSPRASGPAGPSIWPSWSAGGSGGRVSGPSGPSSQCEAPPGGRVTSPGPGLPRRASLLQGPHCRGRLPGDTTTSRSLQGWRVLQTAAQAPRGPAVRRGGPGVTGPETGHYTRPAETHRGEAGEGGSWRNLLSGTFPPSWHFSFLALFLPGNFPSWQFYILALLLPGNFPSCRFSFLTLFLLVPFPPWHFTLLTAYLHDRVPW